MLLRAWRLRVSSRSVRESFEPVGAESSSMARADRRATPSDSTDPAAAQAAEIRKRLRYVEELLDGKPAAVEGE